MRGKREVAVIAERCEDDVKWEKEWGCGLSGRGCTRVIQ